MTSNDDHDFPYYRSPDSIRNESFSRRMRGLDDDEVDEYLNLLADQVQAMEVERQALRERNDQLQAENERLRTGGDRSRTEVEAMRERLAEYEQSGDRVNEQVVELFSQAQLVAEEMVEDARRDTRERLGQARVQERQILEEAMLSAQRTLKDAEAMAARQAAPIALDGTAPFGSHRGPEPARSGADASAMQAELEQVRSLARAAQEQLQSVMDAFASQVTGVGGPASQRAGWQVEAPRPDSDRWGSA